MENVSEPSSTRARPATSPSGLRAGVLSPLTVGLVSGGGIGALLFTAVYLVEGATRPGYDAWQQPVSSLSLGPGGWVQQVNFAVYGALLVLSAVGWYRLLTPVRSSIWFAIWFPVLQGISGLCLIGAGVFSLDPFPGYPPGTSPGPSTLHGTLHSIFAWVLILSLALGCFTWATLLNSARIPERHGWVAYSVVTGVLILIFWGAFVDGASGQIAGLAERLSAVSHDLWLCVLTATLLVQHGTRSSSSADGESLEGARK